MGDTELETSHGSAFGAVPGPLRAAQPWLYGGYLVVVVVIAAILPALLPGAGHAPCRSSELLTGVILVVASVLNVELGRVLEGGMAGSQRPHKALSAWAFASALLLPTWWLLPVVAITYAHAWWRGLRVPVVKWVGSGAYLLLCGLAAAAVATAIAGRDMDLMAGNGLRGVLAVLASGATFLALETALFHISAYGNVPESEIWLRRTLRSGSFYLTESGVLVVGGLSAAIWSSAPWFLMLLIPVYGLTQRAALHVPLQERADHDEKTGLLRFEAWRRQAVVAAERCCRRMQPWSVLFVDIDHFKRYNDSWGHLAGDQALSVIGQTVAYECGDRAVVGRFGGEEFCVFVEGEQDRASDLAERIRGNVASLRVPGMHGLTVSVGLAVVQSDEDVELGAALEQADRALFEAKEAGRNITATRLVGV